MTTEQLNSANQAHDKWQQLEALLAEVGAINEENDYMAVRQIIHSRHTSPPVLKEIRRLMTNDIGVQRTRAASEFETL